MNHAHASQSTRINLQGAAVLGSQQVTCTIQHMREASPADLLAIIRIVPHRHPIPCGKRIVRAVHFVLCGVIRLLAHEACPVGARGQCWGRRRVLFVTRFRVPMWDSYRWPGMSCSSIMNHINHNRNHNNIMMLSLYRIIATGSGMYRE